MPSLRLLFTTANLDINAKVLSSSIFVVLRNYLKILTHKYIGWFLG